MLFSLTSLGPLIFCLNCCLKINKNIFFLGKFFITSSRASVHNLPDKLKTEVGRYHDFFLILFSPHPFCYQTKVLWNLCSPVLLKIHSRWLSLIRSNVPCVIVVISILTLGYYDGKAVPIMHEWKIRKISINDKTIGMLFEIIGGEKIWEAQLIAGSKFQKPSEKSITADFR